MATLKNAFTFGENLRYLRKCSGLTLKSVANQLGIDASLLSKIERNERKASKSTIESVSKFFNINEKEIKREFLCNQIAYMIFEDEGDAEILKVVEEKLEYLKSVRNER